MIKEKATRTRIKEVPGDDVASAMPALADAVPGTDPQPLRKALLAEDNPVNSRVAARILEKLGFQVDIVASGWEAVQAAENECYSVIVLDCDAPAMGGYHTVMEIRHREHAKYKHTPILALTSYTMQWDRKEREAAGIDGYIAKPIQIEAMTSVLARFADNTAYAVAPQLLALDRNVLATLRNLTEGDVAQLGELIDLFLSTTGQLLERMEKGIEDRDFGTVAIAAHSLRGSSGQLGAKRMEDICATIEALARAGADNGIEELVPELVIAYERVYKDLRGVDVARLFPESAAPAPAALAPAVPGGGGEPAPKGVASDEVLVAEDDPLIARFLSSSLTGAGFKVTHVTDGAAAIQAIGSKRFGCVILDINMPKVDGYGVLSEMRTRAETRDIPILILSLRSQEHDIVRAFELGVDDYVTKPFSPLEVISRVRRLLRR